MLEETLKKDIFTKPEMVPNRKGYGVGLLEAGREDKNIVALCADLTESTQTHLFKKAFPERFVQMGVCEQSMASVASGMAAMGKIPFFTSYAMFSPGRNWEQIRTTICYNNVNAKIVGSHAGVSVGPDGGTHQAIEDIAITRVIPRMVVLVPCDVEEVRKATRAAASHPGPVYIRLQRESTGVITTSETPFEIGKAFVMYRSAAPQVTLFACGGILHNVLVAAKMLEDEGIGSIVVNVATVKPLDDAIIGYAKETEVVVTIEEHQRAGGLGSAIAEVISESFPMPVHRIGINDVFGQSGPPKELIRYYGLDSEALKMKIKDILL